MRGGLECPRVARLFLCQVARGLGAVKRVAVRAPLARSLSAVKRVAVRAPLALTWSRCCRVCRDDKTGHPMYSLLQ